MADTGPLWRQVGAGPDLQAIDLCFEVRWITGQVEARQLSRQPGLEVQGRVGVMRNRWPSRCAGGISASMRAMTASSVWAPFTFTLAHDASKRRLQLFGTRLGRLWADAAPRETGVKVHVCTMCYLDWSQSCSVA